MSDIVRLSISLEKTLLTRLERLVREGRYTNRSEFIRDLVRDRLVKREWAHNEEAVGTITLLYNHETRGLSDRLTDVQHQHHEVILASTHIHLDDELCAEIIVVKGRARELSTLSDQLRKHKGVLHASLSLSSTGKHLA